VGLGFPLNWRRSTNAQRRSHCHIDWCFSSYLWRSLLRRLRSWIYLLKWYPCTWC